MSFLKYFNVNLIWFPFRFSPDPVSFSQQSAEMCEDAPGKTLFQIDHSFIGNHHFKRRSSCELAAAASDQLVRTRVFCVRLNRLLRERADNKAARRTLKQKLRLRRTRDLVHAVTALYDNCLPDIGVQSVYDCVCSPKSFTICVLKENVRDVSFWVRRAFFK